MRRLTLAMSACVFLAACGGGGTNSTPTPPPAPTPSPAPSPTPAPTPAPSPSPTPPPVADTFPLAKSGSFLAIHAERFYRVDPKTSNLIHDQGGVSGRSSRPVITYDSASGNYTLASGDTTFLPTATFGAADRTGASGGRVTYAKDTSSTRDRLTLYGNVVSRNAAGTVPIALSYASFGYWTHVDVPTGNTRDAYVLFGFPTAAGDIPKTGTARYDTHVTSTMLSYGAGTTPGRLQDLSGRADFAVRFSNGDVTTTLNLKLAEGGTTFGRYVGGGSIYADNQFSGTFASTEQDFHSGAFMGGFFGPAAAEMGYTFSVVRQPEDQQWQMLSGVVVGTKN